MSDKEENYTPQNIAYSLDEILNRDFPHFKFRKGQRKTILKIIYSILNNKTHNMVLDFPTGTGKSIVAIISARVLEEIYGLSGYIITSNLELQDQYENDINHMGLDWGVLKGLDNYYCHINDKPFSQGECKKRNYSINKAKEKLPCSMHCSYIQRRDKAINTKICILNYSYWLIQMNYSSSSEEEHKSFRKRDFCIFDEAHKIDDIVQNHFSPVITSNFIEDINDLNEFLYKKSFISKKVDLLDLMVKWNTLCDKKSESGYDYNALIYIRDSASELISGFNELKNYLNFHFSLERKIPEEYNNAFKKGNKVVDFHKKLHGFVKLIGKKDIVKTVLEDEHKVVFNVLSDDRIIEEYLHRHSNFSVFMSATFVDSHIWAKETNTSKPFIIKEDPGWDYSKSPIYLFHKSPSLGYKNRDVNLPKAIEIMDYLLEKHKEEKGVIHTGSFYFTNQILQKSKYKDRLLSYKNSEEKKIMLPEFYETDKNMVLIGPSLLEGLDLRDQHSRFQIFFKVPFRQLNSNYVKARMQKDPTWYAWKTMIQIIQGMGRSIRSSNDWAVTYLLDGNFNHFIRKNQSLLPQQFLDRLQLYNF